MRKVYLVKNLVMMALGFIIASCSSDDVAETKILTEEEALANAEAQLGITIDPNQTWLMTKQVTANVTINEDYGETYTVKIYQDNPLVNNEGTLLTEGEVKNGETFTSTFSTTIVDSLFAAYVDKKGYIYVKPAAIEDSVLNVVFGETANAARATHRTATNSYVNIPTMDCPSDYAAEILAKSKELTDKNNEVNWAGSSDYVINYLISDTWSGLVKQLPSAGWKNGSTEPRTVYVKGKWTIPSNYSQKCGQGYQNGVIDGVIIVGNGGELEVNGSLEFVKQARLIVLPGGSITSTNGKGYIEFSNGSKEGEESYNGGTISNVTINQNYGNFFNYGTLDNVNLIGGAGTSCFVNHGKIDANYVYGNNYKAANLQIKNNCWFEANYTACKILENGASAYFKTGTFKMSGGEGGEGLGSYLAADNSSMVRATGEVQLNSTKIIGPTNGERAYIEFDQIEFLNVGETYPIMNNLNLYVRRFDTYNRYSTYETSWNANMNADGNGNAQMVGKAAFNTAPRDASDCAPAFTPGEPVIITDGYPIYSYAFEDTKNGDYDMNDVVIKAQETKDGINLTIVAVGATLDLNIRLYEPINWRNFISYLLWGNYDYKNLTYNGKSEVHEMFGAEKGTMINTGMGAIAQPITITIPKWYSPLQKYDPANLPLAIYSESQGEMNLAITNQCPYGIIIPGNWSWPKEQVRITTAYPHFSSYAADRDSDIGWFNYENSNSVMNESSLGF